MKKAVCGSSEGQSPYLPLRRPLTDDEKAQAESTLERFDKDSAIHESARMVSCLPARGARLEDEPAWPAAYMR